jgi:hypothetical protein
MTEEKTDDANRAVRDDVPGAGTLFSRSSGSAESEVTSNWLLRAGTTRRGESKHGRWRALYDAVVAALVLIAILVVAGAGVYWFVFSFFYAQSHIDPTGRPSTPRPRRSAAAPLDPELAVRVELAAHLPAVEPRLQLLQGNNLDIYVPRSAFEDVPFPDRADVVLSIGKAWCDAVEHVFLPAVRIRDVRRGHVLANFSCTLGRASLYDP